MCGLNAIVTHPENSTNTSKWRVSDVGTAQARQEDTRGNYRNVCIYAAPFAKPFFTSGHICLNMLVNNNDARPKIRSPNLGKNWYPVRITVPANLVFRLEIWGARDNGIPPRSTPVVTMQLERRHKYAWFEIVIQETLFSMSASVKIIYVTTTESSYGCRVE